MAKKGTGKTAYQQLIDLTDNHSTINAANDAMTYGGLLNKNKVDWKHKFIVNKPPDPYSSVISTSEVIFFTKPNLFLFKNSPPSLANVKVGININDLHPGLSLYSTTIRDMYIKHPELFLLLTRGASGNFIPMLTNSVKSNMSLPSRVGEYSEYPTSVFGAQRAVRSHSYTSNYNHTFSLEFEETKSFDIYNLLLIYDEYMNAKSMGHVYLTDKSGKVVNQERINMMDSRIDSDTFSMYKFILDEDRETILHYTKLWGVSISNVPRDSLSDAGNGDPLELGIDFRSEIVKDNDPMILLDFNNASDMKDIPLDGQDAVKDFQGSFNQIISRSRPYDRIDKNGNIFRGFVGDPFIAKTAKGKYKLKYRKYQ